MPDKIAYTFEEVCVVLSDSNVQMDFQKAKQIFAARGGTLRTTEALDAGVHPRTLYAMRDRGELQALSRGVYRLKGAAGSKVSDLVVLAKRMPQGVVCLRSALAFHRLGAKPKTGIDLALPRTAGAYSAYISKQNVYRFGDEAYCAGIETHRIDGVPVRVYGPEKTIADCLKFRSRIGEPLAIRALEQYLRRASLRIEELREFSRICRVERIVDPYLRELTDGASKRNHSPRMDRTTNMLKRQRILLALLHKAGGTMGRTQLVKLAFLLGKETDVSSREAYYDFVPYRYGPFSFALYREMGALERDDYLHMAEDHVELSGSAHDDAASLFDAMASPVKRAIEQIIARYASMTQHNLLTRVYRNYPWYAIASERKDLVPADVPARPTAGIAVYTVGYEGKSVDAFFNGLIKDGIQAILDVRANPISRKYGFARKSMSEIAKRLGIGYVHLPELGITGNFRTDLSDYDSYQRLLDRYEHEMLPKRGDHIRRLVDLIRERPSALLCVEKDVQCCHRSRLAQAASEVSGLPVVHV